MKLPPLNRRIDDGGYHYEFVDVALNSADRTAILTVRGPAGDPPATAGEIEAAGAGWWALQMTRELDDAILMLRTNNTDIGLWLLRADGDPGKVLAAGKSLLENRDNWFVNETAQYLKRTLARLDVSSRSLFAIADSGHLFRRHPCRTAAGRGPLLHAGRPGGTGEFASHPARRNQFRPVPDAERPDPALRAFPGGCRRRGRGQGAHRRTHRPRKTPTRSASSPSRRTNWTGKTEVRLAIEERASLSPDALTGMEASLRFGGRETMATKVFGRLTAWQNWIFIRPNAVGDRGALKLYGTGTNPASSGSAYSAARRAACPDSRDAGHPAPKDPFDVDQLRREDFPTTSISAPTASFSARWSGGSPPS